MTGITDGKYRIRLAADPSPLVGIDPDHRTQTAAVVTRGNNKIWSIHKSEEGKFSLAIEAPGHPKFFVQDAGNNVIAGEAPPSTAWNIEGPDGGPYRIQAPGKMLPPRVWTVEAPSDDKSPVILHPLLLLPQIPENQKWYILRVLPEY